MRFVFISAGNLYICPYISKYIAAIAGAASYDIIYWNRHHINEDSLGAEQVFAYKTSTSELAPKWKKVGGFLGFQRFCDKILRSKLYDGVILLHTNCAVMLYRVLTKRYRGRYIIDIRDYSMENNPVYYQLEKRLVQNSAVNFISSEGYKKFLPEGNYHMVHNNYPIPPEVKSKIQDARGKNHPIRVSFIGLVRFFEQSEKLAASFQGDQRFLFNYFGKNAFLLRDFLNNKGYRANLAFADQFPPEQTMSFYEKTDIINNAYGNHSLSLDYAYSNKLYYAAGLGLPILVSPGTYMAKIVEKYGIGFVFDPGDADAPDKLYQYYIGIDWAAFDKRCEAFCRMVAEDDQRFVQLVKRFIYAAEN